MLLNNKMRLERFLNYTSVHLHMVIEKANLISPTEDIIVIGPNKEKKVTARVDTGATKSSMDLKLAAELKLGPIFKTRKVKSAHGDSLRPVVKGTVIIKGKQLSSDFTLADRNHLKYPVLIGRNLLRKGDFLVDTSTK